MGTSTYRISLDALRGTLKSATGGPRQEQARLEGTLSALSHRVVYHADHFSLVPSPSRAAMIPPSAITSPHLNSPHLTPLPTAHRSSSLPQSRPPRRSSSTRPKRPSTSCARCSTTPSPSGTLLRWSRRSSSSMLKLLRCVWGVENENEKTS
jgi:hypothetical protein